jgi:hypothetical protein
LQLLGRQHRARNQLYSLNRYADALEETEAEAAAARLADLEAIADTKMSRRAWVDPVGGCAV